MAAPTDDLTIDEALAAVLARHTEHLDLSDPGEPTGGIHVVMAELGVDSDELDDAFGKHINYWALLAVSEGAFRPDLPVLQGFLAGVLWQKARERA